jgi:hypothetical protein
MYNKYNTLIYADAKNSTYSIKITKLRWTQTYSDSYDLLAWSYLNMGQKIKH